MCRMSEINLNLQKKNKTYKGIDISKSFLAAQIPCLRKVGVGVKCTIIILSINSIIGHSLNPVGKIIGLKIIAWLK